MKITITEIEASADDIKSSNCLADGLSNMLRGIFNRINYGSTGYAEGEDDNEEEQ